MRHIINYHRIKIINKEDHRESKKLWNLFERYSLKHGIFIVELFKKILVLKVSIKVDKKEFLRIKVSLLRELLR